LKKLIVIGGSGFVGNSLKDYVKLKKTNISNIIDISRTSNKNIIKIKKLPAADYIIYCINSKNIKKSLNYFFYFKNLLKKYSKKTKILFFSSGAVYGPSFKTKKFSEKEKIILRKIDKFKGYKKTYAKEKILLENEFKKLSSFGFRISIARGFTFYGKHILKYNYLISQIIHSIKKNKKLTINDENVYRSYMHADDMCKWLLKIVGNSSSKCTIYNIGSDKIVKIKNLIQFFNENYDAKIIQKINKRKKIDFYVPSTYLANKKLKLKNTINFNHAIKSLINLK